MAGHDRGGILVDDHHPRMHVRIDEPPLLRGEVAAQRGAGPHHVIEAEAHGLPVTITGGVNLTVNFGEIAVFNFLLGSNGIHEHGHVTTLLVKKDIETTL